MISGPSRIPVNATWILVPVEERVPKGEFRMWLASRVFGNDSFTSPIGATHPGVDDSSRESEAAFRFPA